MISLKRNARLKIICMIVGLTVVFGPAKADNPAGITQQTEEKHNAAIFEAKDSTNSTEEYPEACDPGDRLKNIFSWQDYAVLGVMLVIPCCIGIFYGCFGEKQTTSDDFLLGGSSMGTFPMAMSLAASFITAIELLGNPAEMYMYGSQFWLISVAFVLVVPITSQLYLPVYMKLRLTSTFEYLELRFSSPVRTLASGLYILQMTFYTSVAVYAPALALSNVTGLNTYIAVTLVYIVCIFYASQGGMKAVIISDTFQAAVLLGSIIAILAMGDAMIGGPSVVWSESANTNRLELFKMSLNPTIRHSFWSVVVGGTFYWTSMFCSNQASIQKYLSVERLSQARCALWVSSIGLILIYSLNFYTGMIMVTHYKDCDPLKNTIITASDQLLPLYVINVMGHLKGIPGFFVAGIFAASLGTVASALTSMSAVTCQDFIIGAFKINLPESKGATVAKWISLAFGILSFALVFLVEQLGSVLQVALSFNGMVGGVTLGLFSLGMFFPWVNSKGALTGSLVGLAVVTWIGLGAQIAIANNHIHEENKETSILGCPCYNETIHIEQSPEPDDTVVAAIYRISYLWYSAIGCVVTIVVGLIVSLVTRNPNEETAIPVDLLSPPIVALINRLPSKIKDRLNFPQKVNTASETRRISIRRAISNMPTKDMERKRRLSEQNGGVFYSIWVSNGRYTITGGNVNQGLNLDGELTQKSDVL